MDEKMIEILNKLHGSFIEALFFFKDRLDRCGDDYNPFDSFYVHFISDLYDTLVHVVNHDRDLYDRFQLLSNSGQIPSLVDNLPTGSKIPKREE